RVLDEVGFAGAVLRDRADTRVMLPSLGKETVKLVELALGQVAVAQAGDHVELRSRVCTAGPELTGEVEAWMGQKVLKQHKQAVLDVAPGAQGAACEPIALDEPLGLVRPLLFSQRILDEHRPVSSINWGVLSIRNYA